MISLAWSIKMTVVVVQSGMFGAGYATGLTDLSGRLCNVVYALPLLVCLATHPEPNMYRIKALNLTHLIIVLPTVPPVVSKEVENMLDLIYRAEKQLTSIGIQVSWNDPASSSPPHD
jgi:hypothetical protein